jgi:hypothetical protein
MDNNLRPLISLAEKCQDLSSFGDALNLNFSLFELRANLFFGDLDFLIFSYQNQFVLLTYVYREKENISASLYAISDDINEVLEKMDKEVYEVFPSGILSCYGNLNKKVSKEWMALHLRFLDKSISSTLKQIAENELSANNINLNSLSLIEKEIIFKWLD